MLLVQSYMSLVTVLRINTNFKIWVVAFAHEEKELLPNDCTSIRKIINMKICFMNSVFYHRIQAFPIATFHMVSE